MRDQLEIEAEFYGATLSACKLKTGGHTQKPCIDRLTRPEASRYYTVTTFASSVRRGGTRTPIVCSSFEKAKQIVEENVGDIWEYSYHLCVISGFKMDSLYGATYVAKDHPAPDTCAVETEEYWYKWVGPDTETGQYLAIERPDDFRYSGPIG